MPTSLAPIHRPRLAATALMAACAALALLLGGCAQVPHLGPRASLDAPGALASQQSLASPASAEWPADPWWRRYGDPQLDTLMQEAMQGAPSLKIAQARLRQAAALLEQQGAGLRPSTTLNASVTEQRQSYNNGIPAAFVPQGWNDYGRLAIELSYDIDLWGRNRAALEAASSSLQASQAEAAQARLTLAAQIAQAYADFTRLFEQLDTAEAARDVRRMTATLMQERQAQGLETLAAVRQAQARQAQAEGEVLGLQDSLVLQRHLLAALTGAGPDRGLALHRPVVQLDQVQGLPGQLALDLLGRRPDIVSARLRAEAAGRRIDAARAGFYPNLNLSATLGLQSLGLDMLSRSASQVGSIGPALSLPIFDQGRLSGQYRQAWGAYEEAAAQYQQTLTQALQDVADVVSSERALGGRLQQARLATDAAQEAWTLTRRRYDGGLATSLDVLSAEDGYLSQARELTTLQARLFSLDVSLVRALGGGYQSAH
jgi:NodT family efflux transporter outer membrane factor (OMF) lipoprotein